MMYVQCTSFKNLENFIFFKRKKNQLDVNWQFLAVKRKKILKVLFKFGEFAVC